jgi:hypothetical protein
MSLIARPQNFQAQSRNAQLLGILLLSYSYSLLMVEIIAKIQNDLNSRAGHPFSFSPTP